MYQIKEQNKTPGKGLNKMETSNIPDAAFRKLVIRTLKRRKRVDSLSENFNKEIENIKTEVENKKVNSQNEEYNT